MLHRDVGLLGEGLHERGAGRRRPRAAGIGDRQGVLRESALERHRRCEESRNAACRTGQDLAPAERVA